MDIFEGCVDAATKSSALIGVVAVVVVVVRVQLHSRHVRLLRRPTGGGDDDAILSDISDMVFSFFLSLFILRVGQGGFR